MGADSAELSRNLLAAARAGEVERADRLAQGLSEIEPAEIEGDAERISFWLNVYNALVTHELARRPRSGTLLRHRSLFSSVSYAVGGETFTPDQIEHGLLRQNARPPYRMRPLLRPGDPRLAAIPLRLDPRVHFALNCGARSCPPLRAYVASTLDADLEAATRAYLGAEVEVDRWAGRLTLPGLIKLYRADFGPAAAQIAFVTAHMPGDVSGWLSENESRLKLRYARFDWQLVPLRGQTP